MTCVLHTFEMNCTGSTSTIVANITRKSPHSALFSDPGNSLALTMFVPLNSFEKAQDVDVRTNGVKPRTLLDAALAEIDVGLGLDYSKAADSKLGSRIKTIETELDKVLNPIGEDGTEMSVLVPTPADDTVSCVSSCGTSKPNETLMIEESYPDTDLLGELYALDCETSMTVTSQPPLGSSYKRPDLRWY